MTVRNRNYLAALLVVVLVGSVFGTASALRGSSSKPQAKPSAAPAPAAPLAAAPRPAPVGGGCSELSCYGFNNGGYGNHLTGNRGGGNFSGYSVVRFDAFRPVPALNECTPLPGRDGPILSGLGLSGHPGPYFEHRRVAVLRSDNTTATNGVEGTTNWGTGLDFNLNTGATRPTTNPTRPPTQGDPWVGPNWEGNLFCLPLSGDELVRNELVNQKPTITLLHGGEPVTGFGSLNTSNGDTSDIGRVLLGMKALTLRIEITESTSTGVIPIRFEHLRDQVKINIGSLLDFYEYLEAPDVEKANEIWRLSTDPDAAIYASLDDVVPVRISEGLVTRWVYEVDLRVKKKGIYQINVDVNYSAFVGTNTAPYTGLSGRSDTIWTNAVAVKSVNRKS